MHRRSYFPDSVNRAITMNRIQLKKSNAVRERLDQIEADKIAQNAAKSHESVKPSLFSRFKKFMTQPITFGRRA